MDTRHALLTLLVVAGGCDAETLQTIGTYTGYVEDAILDDNVKVVDDTSRFELTLTIRKGPVRIDVSRIGEEQEGAEPALQISPYRNETELWAELTFDGALTIWGLPVEGPKDARDELAQLNGDTLDCAFSLFMGTIDIRGSFTEDFSALEVPIDKFGTLTLASDDVNTWVIPESVGPEPE